MNAKGIAKLWAQVMGDDSELQEDERALVQQATNFIVARWKREAEADDDPEISFRTIYMANKKHAMGVIYAIVEASRAVAAKRDPREALKAGITKVTYQ